MFVGVIARMCHSYLLPSRAILAAQRLVDLARLLSLLDLLGAAAIAQKERKQIVEAPDAQARARARRAGRRAAAGRRRIIASCRSG